MMAVWTEFRRRRPAGAAVSVRCSSSFAASRSSFVLRATVLTLAALCTLWAMAGRARAVTLPNGRAYEQVTPVDKNGVDTGVGTPSTNGNAVNWEAIGGCCGASTASDELFQSSRGAGGWSTTPETPTPSNPLEGLFQEQAPLWWSPDLTKTIYTTPASYNANDQRNPGTPAASSTANLDLYEQGPALSDMSWLSTGPSAPAPDTNQDTATFADATNDGNFVGFDTQEALTPDATGLASLNTPPEYLYERDIAGNKTNLINVATTTLSGAATADETTIAVTSSQAFATGQPITIGSGADQETDTVASVPDATDITLNTGLVNAHASGEAVEALISPDGAILGNGNWLDSGFLPANLFGTTTNAINQCASGEANCTTGSKVFFESPPTFAGGGGGAEGVGSAHLYMRDTATSTTTPLDNPGSAGGAQYEGAAQDGSKVFFTSNEGLGTDTFSDNELYEYNTDTSTLVPLSVGNADTSPPQDGDVLGVTAISNDGSKVYFVAEGVLASNNGAGGQPAADGQPNLYVYDTTAPAASATTFIATLSPNDVQSCIPNCTPNGSGAVLTAEPDISRPAAPTPDGSVMVFDSNANLTNQNPYPPATSYPSTTLAADVNSGATSIQVQSTAGFDQYRTIYIQTVTGSEADAIASIPNGTTLDLRRPINGSHSDGDSVTEIAPYELYRYSYAAGGGTLQCVSCDPQTRVNNIGPTPPIGSASLGATGGGTYAPPGQAVAMNQTGTEIFFDTTDPLVPQDTNTGAFPGGFGSLTITEDVYEWDNGTVSLISDGTNSTGAVLGGTTPSGNDVFFTSMAQLVPQDVDGYDDIYDARVGGGFPAPAPSGTQCASPETCRTGVAPTEFFPVPGSSTLIAPNISQPTFTVSGISARQRNQLIKTGKVTLTVSATAPGQIKATVFAKIGGLQAQVASGRKTFSGATGGSGKITLRLARSARRTLSKKHSLALTITVGYSQSTQTDVATLTLKTKHKTHGKRFKARDTSTRERRVKGA